MVGIFTEFLLSPSSPRSQSLPRTDSWVKPQRGFSKTFTQPTPCGWPPVFLPCKDSLFFVLQFLQCLIFSVFAFVFFLVFSPATSPCIHTHTHTHTHIHSHSYVVNFLSIGIVLYLTLHPLCLEQLRYVDEILPGSGKDRWRNTNPYSPNTSPFTYISFPQSLIGRQHILLVNYIGSIIVLLELES